MNNVSNICLKVQAGIKMIRILCNLRVVSLANKTIIRASTHSNCAITFPKKRDDVITSYITTVVPTTCDGLVIADNHT